MAYGTRRVVAVPFLEIPGLLYGFRTSVEDASSTALGHIAALGADGKYIRGVVLGVNSPKPPKAKKFFGSATKRHESSFIDPAKINAARAAGWKITPPLIQRMKSTAYSKAVYIDTKIADPAVNAQNAETAPAVIVKYAWRMPKEQYDKIGADRVKLGITDVTSSDLGNLVLGASYKPFRASKTIVEGSTAITITTFVAHNKIDSLPAGWG